MSAMDYGVRRKGKSPYLVIEIGAAGGSSGSARSDQNGRLQRSESRLNRRNTENLHVAVHALHVVVR